MNLPSLRPFLFALGAVGLLSIQGCVAVVAGAGAAAGYQAYKHGYRVQSPVAKDASGGYKPQDPVTHKDTQ